jgi:Sugar transferases involved in lipopolysaccharide synthesis
MRNAVRTTVKHLAARLTVKRTLDVLLGTALLALAAPALTLGALALALTPAGRAGGVLTRDIRVGLGGRPFVLRSLRTRTLRLDLLSRLPHVVRGELSLVGPTPLAPGAPGTEQPGAGYWRQELRPGLTGPAQVRARSSMPWDEPALLDAHYAEHHGTGPDLVILAQTVTVALRTALGGLARRAGYGGKGGLSDADHRPPGYRAAE